MGLFSGIGSLIDGIFGGGKDDSAAAAQQQAALAAAQAQAQAAEKAAAAAQEQLRTYMMVGGLALAGVVGYVLLKG